MSSKSTRPASETRKNTARKSTASVRASSSRKGRPTQADGLRSTREAHARETAEDYVEAIAELIAETGEARVTDLAKKFGVTHVTVNRTVARLQRLGYVTSLPYRSIFLTDLGRETATASRRRHEIVVEFLRLQGVPEAAAQRDAEGIEHHVSAETLAVFERALKRAQVK
ncbi:manganese-binding transcriptional regulator MntR [Opitutaceae bacterium TAV4]|uniref:manganese-binding transcriptional regulator MntR n=1 Tax=Geminisphaera colitermitum TaxID=1148786 RepID=UPI0005B9572F|nr:manganese-binding transcriptional regulator MntR [Geminisphaera colitermitum]RRJ96290.1 manganese-binding transcriptional regulator MntR [Opitutaceae bacterium TAV4]RRK00439.1 manganese-binding transcriptional regulator MntR [Opitutaceae bacterium TAV3]